MNRIDDRTLLEAIDGSAADRPRGEAADGHPAADPATDPGAPPSAAERAIIALEQLGAEPAPALPSALRAKIVRDGEAFFADAAAPPAGHSAARPQARLPWWRQAIPVPVPLALAAAVVAFCALVILPDSGTAPDRFDPASLERRLVAAGAVAAPLKPLGGERWSKVSGEVLWSASEQRGLLRVSGIPANDPAEAQYQLWIVAPDRDDEPVDGGAFDVRPGETTVEIEARLPVSAPRAFAVTLEKPGGVVVSDGPLLFVATLPIAGEPALGEG